MSATGSGSWPNRRTAPSRAPAAALAGKHGTALVYGYPEQAGDMIYNAAACIDRDGRAIAHHRKLRLPNEFEKSYFATGDTYTLFGLNGWSVAMLVCYDVEFPEAVRACAARGAQLVIAPTALKKEWTFVARSMISTRAFENCFFVAYANYCGMEGYVRISGRELLRRAKWPRRLQAAPRRSLSQPRWSLPTSQPPGRL